MTEARRTYLNSDKLPFPFCPGCGHSLILKALDQALVQLALPPEEIIIVTDIGCTGLSDKYFSTNAFHGLHGRSITYATGLKLAKPEKKVIVLIGDGGCGIGGHHLINAARRNLDLTVLVFNNFNYGMTGGEHSVTTPPGTYTSTTGFGQIERPMDICGTAAVNGGSYIARTTSFDKTLPDLIARAIVHSGFSLLDIWELCTSYFAVNNAFGKKAISETLASLHFDTGILVDRAQPSYLQAYREAVESKALASRRKGIPLTPHFTASLQQPLTVMLAGAAGEKIISAASAFSRGGVLSGLFSEQRNDYPVTVKTGHSLAEIVLSPEKLLYASGDRPNFLLILFEEGLTKAAPLLSRLTPDQTIFINASLECPPTQASVRGLHFERAGTWSRRSSAYAIMALGELLRAEAIYPIEAFLEALQLRKRYAAENADALKASEGILSKKR